jgi:hypothetical protein
MSRGGNSGENDQEATRQRLVMSSDRTLPLLPPALPHLLRWAWQRKAPSGRNEAERPPKLAWPALNPRSRPQDFLICIEMFLAALAHAYAFPPR